jgi:N-acetylmuramoyl-L-alanine amidase
MNTAPKNARHVEVAHAEVAHAEVARVNVEHADAGPIDSTRVDVGLGTDRASRREWLRSAGTLALSFAAMRGAPAQDRAIEIVAVRVWPAAEYTRVTLESEQALTVTHRVLRSPDRLSIDVAGLVLTDALRELVGKIRPDDPFIAGVRVAQFQPTVVRLVLDLKQPVAPQLFTLQPVAAYKHRLVFDLYPTLPVDPLTALLRKQEKAEREAAAAVRDALGDLIAQVDGKDARDAGAKAGPPAPPSSASGPTPTFPRVPEAAPGPTSEQQKKVNRLIIVAIDPGHGGEDPGAIGPKGLREKDVVLAVATGLRDKLDGEANMRAYLTRDADYFVPLQERVRKARRVQADLFVSIHADAYAESHARGASVFALSDGAASSASARWLASKENAADQIGGVNLSKKVQSDPTAVKAILDMSTSAQIRDSLALGREVLGQLDRVGRLHKQRVEQAGFAVLKAPDVPSILVETAFISNPEEEAKLRDPQYRAQLIDALYHGIRRYFSKNPPLARQRSL